MLSSLSDIVARFRTWNHARLAAADLSRAPMTVAQKRKLCGNLGYISSRGPAVNDADYQARLAEVGVSL